MKLFFKHITPPKDLVSPMIDKAAEGNPFSVPDNYFDDFQKEMHERVKNVPQTPKYNIYRWVAYSSVAVLFVLVGIYFINQMGASKVDSPVYDHKIVFNDSAQDVYLESNETEKTIYIHLNKNMSKDEIENLLIVFGNDVEAHELAKTQYLALNDEELIPIVDAEEDDSEEVLDTETNINSYSYIKARDLNSNESYAEVFEMVSTEGSILSWPENICVERPILLNAFVGDNYNYEWSTGSLTESIRVNETGIFSVTATNKENSNEKVHQSILVRYIPVPVLNNEYYFNACVGETVNINVKQGVDAYRYNWPELNTNKAVANITEPGKYKVEIRGCRTYLDSFVVIYKHCDLSIPAIISPNDDGLNDVFLVDNLDHYKGTAIEIYNSRQKLVYQSDDYQNDWTAENLPDGAYFYLLKFVDGISQEGIVNVRR